VGQKLIHHIAKTLMTPTMQYGSNLGKQCLSAVLKKILAHDYVCLTWTTAAFMKNDARCAYDRIVNNLVLLILRKLGFPGEVSKCLGDIWDKVTHQIKTMYGIATPTYHSTTEQPLYGPGQGSTCGPPFYALMYWFLVNSLDPTLTGAQFTSICKS
jgi:hypothetical protein